MTEHPLVPYDQGLVDDVAARLDLRVPNKEALEAVAKAFDGADGQPFEVVCDVATAVGKTYLAAGLIDYLAATGVRHFMFVTPGRTILDKTVNNFTEGHPKSVLGGMETRPVIITADNFNTGAAATALHDDDEVKLYVFTVQALIKPDKNTRKTRKEQEWLGEDLYQFLQGRDDLVVISDEHHVYSEKAKAFSEAVRDLDAMALVGLTATPAKSDLDKVVYHYPLARAIAERYVKTPVLVGRKDDAHSVDTRLRDGLLLLEAKQKAADAYATATGKPSVNAVMFVVADTIDNANAVAEVLRKPGLFEKDYEQRVLVVHSDAPDDALARLAAVEDPDSPVRVIVSVAMLKEGWDVKNIFVICSLRPSISDVLTEQTLGRGLRLPWGAYTDVELLDTVEVLSHERYEQLLERAGVLLEGLTEQRVKPEITPAPVPGPVDGTDTVVVTPAAPAGETGAAVGSSPTTGAAPQAANPGDGESAPVAGDLPANETGFVVTSVEARVGDATAQAAAASKPVPCTHPFTLPRVVRTVTARSFRLTDVTDQPFIELGRQLASAGDLTLQRKVLEVVADPTAPAGYRLVPADAKEQVAASTPNLPFGGAAKALREAICGFDVVPSDKQSLNAAKRLADAAVAGAGSEDALSAYLNSAIAAAQMIINNAYKAAPAVIERTVERDTFDKARLNTRTIEPNRYGKFSRKVAYDGWTKSAHSLQWFDSTPERDLANLVDGESSVKIWDRLQRGEFTVHWEGGHYSPDFYVDTGKVHYLVEVKADRDVETDLVQAKKQATEEWARFVADEGDYGTWRYVLMPESVLKTAKTFTAALTQAGAQ